MEEKIISLVVPMRSRLDTTKLLLESLEKNTSNKSNIELICITDNDDIELNKFLDSFSASYLIKRIIQKQKNPFNLSSYYQDGLNVASNPKFMWALGNDCEIVSYGWDDTLKKLPTKSGVFYYIRIDDGVHVPADYSNNIECGCCFPILTFNYFKTTGEFYPIETSTWGADHLLWNALRLFNNMRNGYVEVVDMSSTIKIVHHSPHSKDERFKRPKDDSYYRMMKNNSYFDSNGKMHRINACVVKNGIC